MSRFFCLAALAVLAATAAAQPTYDRPYYNGLDGPPRAETRPGVRVGVGIGPYVYSAPHVSATGGQRSGGALATHLAVTAEVLFPLTGPLYGRAVGGLANIGAGGTAANPYATGQTLLAEADLLYYLVGPRAGGLSPYVFSGLSALVPTGDRARGVPSAALAVPVGVGVEYGLTRNLTLYAEGSYRLGLTDIGPDLSLARVPAAAGAVDVCDVNGPGYNLRACEGKDREPCYSNGGFPACPRLGANGDVVEDRDRFNSGLVLAGLRLGFGRAPAPLAVPAYVPPAVVESPAPVVASESPAPAVCDLVELNSVTFDYGAGTLDRRARSLLDENVDLMLSNPACCVFIDGYTDTSEGDRFGLNLGGRRAQAVYDYYLSRGIEASRLQIRNRGVAVPNCDKEDPGPGCERNRRVESLPVDCERFRFLIDNPSYDPY